MNKIFSALPTTIFEVMSVLAREKQAINLGQGFPDDPGPEDVRRIAAEAVMDGYNQYPSMMGIPELRQAIADHYKRFQGLELDPVNEVMVRSQSMARLCSMWCYSCMVEIGGRACALPVRSGTRGCSWTATS